VTRSSRLPGPLRRRTTVVAVALWLAACGGQAADPTTLTPASPTVTPTPSPTPTPTPSPTPSPLPEGICGDLRELQATILDTLEGRLSPVLAVLRLNDIRLRLESRAGELAVEGARVVNELADDVVDAVDEVRRAIRERGDVLDTLAEEASDVAAEAARIISERC
jgi:hypothetical protein